MEAKILKIGKHEIDISWISVERTLKAMDKYNSILTLEGKDKTDSNVISIMVEAVVILIRRDFSFTLDYLRRLFVTKKYILKHLNYKELNDFMENALEPILGDKKKAIKGQQAIETVAEKMAEMNPEVLKQLLQSAVVSSDGQETISTSG